MRVSFDHTDWMENDGRIHHWFASNCDWRGSENGAPRPEKLTCLPIGIENRYNSIGRDPKRYLRAMTGMPLRDGGNGGGTGKEGILYVSFVRSTIKPQRAEALSHLESLERRNGGRSLTWVTRHAAVGEKVPWDDFASHVRSHRFVLCPHGHGLDTHRLWEVLLLGSIPVVRTSTLDSNYDGLPVVILREWSELTESRLEEEWDRLSKRSMLFELDKVFFPYWENVIRKKMDEARRRFDVESEGGEGAAATAVATAATAVAAESSAAVGDSSKPHKAIDKFRARTAEGPLRAGGERVVVKEQGPPRRRRAGPKGHPRMRERERDR
uniref:Exostosin GT47 domain-containing protein n=1 Tax=Odontella aurita TaxID=265563 RepID=A0A7S4JIN9_9STRA|mmetsp:Transcript_47068/g.142538  ORF Transcript_47068/g.142538 Transcript_47068/m.142538 type:complete len:325 (+) Transcript_47068:571-1545(+)